MVEGEFDLRRYLLLARRWLWLIVGCAILAAVSAYIISARTPPAYSAGTTLLVRPAPNVGVSDYNAVLMSERLAQTYISMITEEPVMEAAIARLGLTDETPHGLAGKVGVELVRNTQLIRLSVRDSDPNRAVQLANAVAEAFIALNQEMQEARYADSLASVRAQMDEFERLMEETQAAIDALGEPQTPQDEAELARLQTVLAGYRNTYASFLQNYEQMRLTATLAADDIVVYKEARTATRVGPRVAQNTLLAGIVGALMAVGVAFLVEYLDDTIKTPDDVSRALGLNTLAVIGRLNKKKEKELVMIHQPLSHIAESFRVLRTNIRYSSVDKPLRSLLVTSAGPTEGKSFVAANLAVAMAQSGVKVVVVDADLRRPRLHRLFGVHPREGLTGALVEGSLDGRLQPAPVEGLALLPAGELPPNPVELLGSQRMRETLSLLTRHVDMVLLDSPPALPVSDAAVLAQSVDGVLLVVDAGETRRGAAQRALDTIRQVGGHVVGVVLNSVTGRAGSYYYYYYYYYDHDYYGEGGERRRRRRRQKRPQAARVLSGGDSRQTG